MKTTLKSIVEKKLGSNTGRHIQTSYPALYAHILENTAFLDEVSFSERIYCIINDITSCVIDNSGKQAKFINLYEGYRLGRQPAVNKEPTSCVTRDTISAILNADILAYAKLVNSTDAARGKRIRQHCMQWPNNSGKHLYLPGNVENVDYVVCPITNLRKASIRINYISSILGMTLDEYIEIVGKDFVLIAPAHCDKIKTSLKEVDTESGCTKHELSVIKTQAILNTPNEDGKTGHNLRTAKTVNTHKTKIDENGLNGFQRIGLVATIKGTKTKQQRGMITADENKTIYKHYKNFVLWLTSRNSKHIDKGNVGLAGKDGAYQVDHRYSIFAGFNNKISPLIIAHSSNLELLPWKTNLSKHTACSITEDELLELVGKTSSQSLAEFDAIVNIINNEFGAEVSAGLLYEKFNKQTKLP